MKYNMPVLKSVVLVIFLFSMMPGNAQTYSDADLKMNVTEIHNPLQLISQLEPKSYEYNTSRFSHLNLPAGVQYGFMAEDVSKVMPGVVRYNQKSYMRGKNLFRTATVPVVNLESMVPVLIASVREQQQVINRMARELQELRSILNEIKAAR